MRVGAIHVAGPRYPIVLPRHSRVNLAEVAVKQGTGTADATEEQAGPPHSITNSASRRTELSTDLGRGAKGEAAVDWILDPEIWASLLTLTALEIVLGIDNLVFIAILAGRLPAEQQNRARQIGLALALLTRLALLASITWIIGLTQPLFELFAHPVSWRDIVLIAGGLFLLYKGTREIHHVLEADEPEGEEEHVSRRTALPVWSRKSCSSISCSRWTA